MKYSTTATILVWIGGIAAWTFSGWASVGFYVLGGVVFSAGTLVNQALTYNDNSDFVIAIIHRLGERLKRNE